MTPTLRLVTAGTLAMIACTPAFTADRAPDDGPRRVRIYQLLVRTFGNDRGANVPGGTLAQNGSGTYDDLDAAAIAAITSLGTTHVWLTGVPRQASLTAWPGLGLPAEDPDVVKGRAGSPYAVIDYFDTSPELAVDGAKRLEAFDAAVARLHAANLKVIIDLVPNHVARGYATAAPDSFGAGDDPSRFFAPDNSFFYLVDPPGRALRLSAPAGWSVDGMDGRYAREDGGPGRPPKATGNNHLSADPGANDWYETVKLNWGFDFVSGATRFEPVPKTWARFDAILAFWQARGVDGFRADFAHYVPAAAWRWLLGQARERDPDAFFIAEAYAASDAAPASSLPNLVAAGFDAIYDDPVYDTVREIYQGVKWANDLDAVAPSDFLRDRSVRYLENHDERRAASPLVPGGGDSGFGSAEAAFPAAAALYLGHGGPILFHAGQEVGEPGVGREGFGGDDGRTSIFDYWSVPTLAAYKRAGWKASELPAAQRALHERYAALLALADEPAFRAGASFYSLSGDNRSQDRFGGRGRYMTAFLRYRPGRQVMLVIANFDAGSGHSPQLRIPARALAFAGLGAATTLTFTPRLGGVEAVQATSAELGPRGATFTVPPLTTGVWEVEALP